MKIGPLERLLRSSGLLIWGWILTLILFGVLLGSTENPFVSVVGAFAPAVVLCARGVRVHGQTGRWWFRRLPIHGPLEAPNYNTPVGDFWVVVESFNK